MKAIAVTPGIPNTVHLAELPAPTVDEIPNGRGVLVRVLRVGEKICVAASTCGAVRQEALSPFLH